MGFQIRPGISPLEDLSPGQISTILNESKANDVKLLDLVRKLFNNLKPWGLKHNDSSKTILRAVEKIYLQSDDGWKSEVDKILAQHPKFCRTHAPKSIVFESKEKTTTCGIPLLSLLPFPFFRTLLTDERFASAKSIVHKLKTTTDEPVTVHLDESGFRLNALVDLITYKWAADKEQARPYLERIFDVIEYADSVGLPNEFFRQTENVILPHVEESNAEDFLDYSLSKRLLHLAKKCLNKMENTAFIRKIKTIKEKKLLRKILSFRRAKEILKAKLNRKDPENHDICRAAEASITDRIPALFKDNPWTIENLYDARNSTAKPEGFDEFYDALSEISEVIDPIFEETSVPISISIVNHLHEQLRTLNLKGCHIEYMDVVKKKYNLRSLTLSYYEDVNYDPIKKLTNLKELTLYGFPADHPLVIFFKDKVILDPVLPEE